MARPIKKGINYFNLDVTFFHDIKIRKIRNACGNQSIAILIYLLCTIYEEQGYYMRWDEDIRFLVADDLGAKESAVQDVVDKACAVGFFENEMFEEYKVLTSKRIQENYKLAAKQKKDGSIDPNYQLPKVSNHDNGVSNDGNSVSSGDNPVSSSESTHNREEQIISDDNRIKNQSSGKPKYASTDEPYQIAKHLFKRIRANNSDFSPKFGEKDLQRWANDIRLAHERDGREYEALNRMVDWCQTDSFWQGNILSGSKLRAKYDTMAAQANAKRKPKNNSRGGRKEIVPKWAQTDGSQTGSKPNAGNQMSDADHQRLSERIAKITAPTKEG